MKVFVMHHAKDIGGGTLSCFDIVKILSQKYKDVSLILPMGNHAAQNEAIEKGFNVIQEVPEIITFNYYNGGSNLARVMIKFLTVKIYENKWRDFFKKEKPDLVILNSIVQFPMLKILNELDINSLQVIRETIKKDRTSIVNRYIASKLNKSNNTLFISKYDKNSWELCDKVKQFVIPDVVDVKKNNMIENKNDLNLEPNIFYLLYVGGMNEIKGSDVLIKTMNDLKKYPIKLLFLGNVTDFKGVRRYIHYKQYKYSKKVKNYISENNLSDNVIFLGTQSEMEKWYINSELVIFPAKKAHQARPVYEAGNAKKTIILSDFENFQEYVKDGYNGVYFEADNSNDLTEKISYLFNNPELLKQLGENNYLETVKNHSYDSAQEKWGEIFKSISN